MLSNIKEYKLMDEDRQQQNNDKNSLKEKTPVKKTTPQEQDLKLFAEIERRSSSGNYKIK